MGRIYLDRVDVEAAQAGVIEQAGRRDVHGRLAATATAQRPVGVHASPEARTYAATGRRLQKVGPAQHQVAGNYPPGTGE